MTRSSLTLKTARWSAEHPWRAVLLWIAFVGAAVGAGSAFSTVTTTDADYRLGESGRADEIITDSNLDGPGQESVLVTSRDGAELEPAQVHEVTGDIRDAMAPLDAVQDVGAPLIAENQEAALVPIILEETSGNDPPDVSALLAATSDVQDAHPALSIEQGGEASIVGGIEEQFAQDMKSAEGISLPVTLALMLLAFGALIAAGIPVLLAMSSVVATIGIYAPISHILPSEPAVSSMIVLIGMAVGVDYSLFYMKRAREERDRGRSKLDAVEIAAATSGHSVVVSGLAVIVSMAGLYLIGDVTFNSLATGAILVVAIAVLGSITVLPGLLAKFGKWVDRPRVPLLWRLNRRIGRGGISRRLLGPVVRHPKAALMFSVLLVAGLTAPALAMKVSSGTLDTLPQAIPEVQTIQRIDQTFPSEGVTMQVVVESDADAGSDVIPALEALADEATATGDFAASADAVSTSRDGTASMLTLASSRGESSENADLVAQMRDDLAPKHLDGLDGAEWAVGGLMAEEFDSAAHQRDKLPWVIGFVLLLTMVMMGVTFRSVPIALLTTGLNLASVGAAFGVLTLVFQHGFGEGLLGFTSSGFVIDWIPLFIFVVLVGLSMDYHVFVLSRIREAVERGLPPRLAVESGVSETAGVVTSAAAVMVSVFAIFATLSMLEMKMMGVGLAVAVLIDATLIRVVMLPALLVLLGERAWWPKRPSVPEAEPLVEAEPAYAMAVAAADRHGTAADRNTNQ
jgi:putative drug exporter of the RND superfamily